MRRQNRSKRATALTLLVTLVVGFGFARAASEFGDWLYLVALATAVVGCGVYLGLQGRREPAAGVVRGSGARSTRLLLGVMPTF